jgi:8-oxo-dGTP pyrophosphatase MutT (NUDIX family)
MSHRFPVSIKGVILREGRVVLLRNERDEWELPGGKLEPDETPEACLSREIDEELGLAVTPEAILDCWVYEPLPGAYVAIVTYGCVELEQSEAVLSDEHRDLGWFPLQALDGLWMPDGYRQSIRRWAGEAAGGASRSPAAERRPAAR